MKRPSSLSSGILYAILAVVGVLFLVIEEIDSATDEEILSHYADSGNRNLEITGFAIATVGALLFVWFLSALRTRFRSEEAEPTILPDLGFGAGLAGAAMFVAAATLLSATSNAVEISSLFEVDPDLARLAVSTGYVFLIASVAFNCVLVATTSLLALRTPVLPNWLGWAGFAVIVLAVIEIFLLPVIVIPAWALVVSVMLTLGPGAEAGAGEREGTDREGQVTAGP